MEPTTGKAKIPSEILINRAIANARREEESRDKPPKTEADSDAKRDSGKAKFVKPPSARGSAGGGGMNPTDIEKVPGKRQLKMKSGGSVKSSASKRADGRAIKGKTRGRMV